MSSIAKLGLFAFRLAACSDVEYNLPDATLLLQLGLERVETNGAELQQESPCDCTTVVATAWSACGCGSSVANERLAEDIASLQSVAATEHDARLGALDRQQDAFDKTMKLQEEAMLHQQEADVQKAQLAAEVKARKGVGDTVAVVTVQAAEMAHMDASSTYAHDVALRSARDLAQTVVAVEEKSATKGIDEAARALAETVQAGSESVAVEAARAAASSATASFDLKGAAATAEVAREHGVEATLGEAASVIARRDYEILEARAQKSAAMAEELEAQAAEDQRRIQEAEANYNQLLVESSAARKQQQALEEQMAARLKNVTIGVMSNAIATVAVKTTKAVQQAEQAQIERSPSSGLAPPPTTVDSIVNSSAPAPVQSVDNNKSEPCDSLDNKNNTVEHFGTDLVLPPELLATAPSGAILAVATPPAEVVAHPMVAVAGV